MAESTFDGIGQRSTLEYGCTESYFSQKYYNEITILENLLRILRRRTKITSELQRDVDDE